MKVVHYQFKMVINVYCTVVGHLCFHFVYMFSSLFHAKRLVQRMPVTIKDLGLNYIPCCSLFSVHWPFFSFCLFHLFMQNGWTALEQASFNGHHKVVECLLGAGANPDLQDVVRTGVCTVKQGGILRISDILFVAIQIDWST